MYKFSFFRSRSREPEPATWPKAGQDWTGSTTLDCTYGELLVQRVSVRRQEERLASGLSWQVCCSQWRDVQAASSVSWNVTGRWVWPGKTAQTIRKLLPFTSDSFALPSGWGPSHILLDGLFTKTRNKWERKETRIQRIWTFFYFIPL